MRTMEDRKMLTQASIEPHLHFDEYLAEPGLNKSSAQHLLRSPAHYLAQFSKPRKDTPALTRGLALHCKLSDDEHCLAVAPEVNKRTKAGKELWADFEIANSGKIIVTPDIDDATTQMAKAIKQHPAVQAFGRGQDEVSLFVEHEGVRIKCRIDRLTDDAIIDWKTTTSIDDPSRDAAKFHYDLQAAWYRQCVYELTGEWRPFVFVFVETEAPWSVRVMRAGESMLARGEWHMRTCLDKYKWCKQHDEWPGFSTTPEDLELPNWARIGAEDVIEW